MTDTQFDDFFNDKLKDHQASVPPGLWDKVKDAQFDKFVGDKLKDLAAPVSGGLWDKITDSQFDEFIGGKLYNTTTPVPAGLWDKVTDGQFDQFIAGKLYDHSAPVPEGLWDKVKPKKDHERRPGFIIFRYPAVALLILALLLGGSLGGYLFLKQGNETGNGAKALIVPQAANANGKTATSSTINNKADNTAVPLNNEKNSLSSTDHAANALPVAPVNSNKVTKDDDLKTDAAGNALPATRSSAASSLTDAFVSSTIKKTGNSKGENAKATTLANNNHGLIAGNPATEDNSFEYIEPYLSNRLTAVTIPFSPERSSSMQNLLDKQLSTANHTRQFRNVIICPADNKNRNTDWFLEAYASPDIAFKSVSNNTATQQYLLTKDSSESMQVSYSAGLRLVKPINDNILLKVGLNYSQINQKYVYRTENEVKTTTVVTVRTIIRAPGDTVIVHDTSTLQQIGFKNNTVKNRFRSFDIPVTVGYQFGNDDLKFGINAGVVFNLTSWYQGVILDSSLATVPLNKTGNGVYKTNIGLGLYTSFSVVKRLSDDMHVFVEPYFRYNLSGMTNAQAPYNQKFSLGGLALGLRLNLNRK